MSCESGIGYMNVVHSGAAVSVADGNFQPYRRC